MQDLNDLYYFVQVIDHHGFAPAARALGVPKSKLSRRIALLEERLGVRLIHRSSRRFAVTEVGQEYYRHCLAMLVEAEAAQGVIDQVRTEPRGVIKMSCPTALLNFQFGELLVAFMDAYPRVEIHLESTNRRVDVVGEGFDLAIRVRFPPLEQTDLVMRKLDESTQCLVASPGLANGHRPKVPSDLAGFPSLDLGPAHRDHQWCLEHLDGSTALIVHKPKLITDDMTVLRRAALAGVGIVQLPTLMVWRDLAEGRLVSLIDNWRPRSGIVHTVFPSRRGLLPSVRTLVDFLASECKKQNQTMQYYVGNAGSDRTGPGRGGSKSNQDELLDEASEESFPASGPIAVALPDIEPVNPNRPAT